MLNTWRIRYIRLTVADWLTPRDIINIPEVEHDMEYSVKTYQNNL